MAIFYKTKIEIGELRFSWFSDWIEVVQRSVWCRSRRELSNAHFLAKFGFETAENEPCQVTAKFEEKQRHLAQLRLLRLRAELLRQRVEERARDGDAGAGHAEGRHARAEEGHAREDDHDALDLGPATLQSAIFF